MNFLQFNILDDAYINNTGCTILLRVIKIELKYYIEFLL